MRSSCPEVQVRRLLAVLLSLVILAAVSAPVASADEWVNGYFRGDGTYVQGYYRSSPDGIPYNNYSYRGNVNPYTGSIGTKSYDPSYPSYRSYGSYGGYGSSYGSYSSYPSYGRSYGSYGSWGSAYSSGYSRYSYDWGW